LEIGPDERLLPVAHFDKEPARVFGVPFFIKIRNEEKISVIRERIKEMLEVPDKEFEKVLT
jgi:ubiquitin carboxyl-terminal hydrolase 7